MALVDSKPVQKVIAALKAAGIDDAVRELEMPVESPGQAAEVLDIQAGAFVTAKVFAIGKRMVLALCAGAPDPDCHGSLAETVRYALRHRWRSAVRFQDHL